VGAARDVVRRRGAARGRPLRLVVRVPVGLGENLEAGIDTEAWIGDGLADIVVLGSPGYCVHEIDIAAAVACARDSGVLVFTGFDGSTYGVSPQEGYERNVPAVLRAAALNGYREGADGVHVFNYDYPSHRAGPSPSDDFNDYDELHLQTLLDLRDPEVLARRQRCYYLPAPDHSPGGDHRLQLPRKLALVGRGAGGEHALRLTVHDDNSGRAGRIAPTQLRLRLVDADHVTDRLRFEVNGQPLAFAPSRRLSNSRGEEWLVFDDPPLKEGVNTVLLLLEGMVTPEPWPSLERCEIVVFAP
jgi:hypothetical protein